MSPQKKAVWAWCLYDWAITAFPVVVITFIFASYFSKKIAANVLIGTQQWADALAISGIVVALLAPILGTAVDYYGKNKFWLIMCTFGVMVSASLFWFAYPQVSSTYPVLGFLMLGNVALNVGLVIYNAILMHIASPHNIGRISGWGLGLSYLGGLVVLLIAYFGFVKLEPSWLGQTSYQFIRICGPLVALWILLFSWPLFKFMPFEVNNRTPSSEKYGCFYALKLTCQSLLKDKNLCLFLIGQLIYVDGLNTILAFAGIFGAGTFDMSLSDVLLLGIVLNLIAGVGALLLSGLTDYLGPKKIVLISLFCLIGFGCGAVLANHLTLFWVFSCAFSAFVGVSQSASRVFMAALIPGQKATSLFGFYTLSGRLTTFLGPLILGYLTAKFQSQRIGLASMLIFLIAGVFIFLFVKLPPNLKRYGEIPLRP